MRGLSITPDALPAAVAGHGYHVQLQVDGGRSPYVFQCTHGWLPLNMVLCADGLLLSHSVKFPKEEAESGTTAITYDFTIRAVDYGGNYVDQPFTIKVAMLVAASGEVAVER